MQRAPHLNAAVAMSPWPTIATHTSITSGALPIGLWAGWTVVGAAMALGLVSLGWLLLIPAGVGMGWLARRAPRWPSFLGLFLGSGAVCVGIGALEANALSWSWIRVGLVLWSACALGVALDRLHPRRKSAEKAAADGDGGRANMSNREHG